MKILLIINDSGVCDISARTHASHLTHKYNIRIAHTHTHTLIEKHNQSTHIQSSHTRVHIQHTHTHTHIDKHTQSTHTQSSHTHKYIYTYICRTHTHTCTHTPT